MFLHTTWELKMFFVEMRTFFHITKKDGIHVNAFLWFVGHILFNLVIAFMCIWIDIDVYDP